MRKLIGVICVFLGIVCVLSSVCLLVYNRWEDSNAEEISQDLLEEIGVIIDEKQSEQSMSDDTVSLPNAIEKSSKEMPTVKVGDYDCIGILSVPVLDLELPVLTDWSYAKLKQAPCHYYGSCFEKDFVIAAHNYKAHFGRLSELQTGDLIFFTDVNGTVYYYEVVLLETLPGEATKEMITSGFDLSLYTCTSGGGSRVTVRCNSVNDRVIDNS